MVHGNHIGVDVFVAVNGCYCIENMDGWKFDTQLPEVVCVIEDNSSWFAVG